MDPHEKNAVLIAVTLPPALRDLLRRLLFVHTPRNGREATLTVAEIAAIGGCKEGTTRQHLKQLAELDYIEIIQNGAAWIDGRFYQRPNTYRVLTVAERYERQQARAATEQREREQEASEVEILTVSLDYEKQSLDSPEVRIPSSACTGSTAREAALAFWLPTLPPLPREAKQEAHEQARDAIDGERRSNRRFSAESERSSRDASPPQVLHQRASGERERADAICIAGNAGSETAVGTARGTRRTPIGTGYRCV